MHLIDDRIKKRAILTFQCLPLNKSFYLNCESSGLTAEDVFNKKDIYCSDRSNWFKTINDVEDAFCWLIKIGVLRREVDGQGLTASIRITPMGRDLISKESEIFSYSVSFRKRLRHWAYRKWPFK